MLRETTNLQNPLKIQVTLMTLPSKISSADQSEASLVALGVIDAKELIDRAEPEVVSHDSGDGYQRAPSQRRVRDLTDKLIKNEVDIIQPITMNFRHFNDADYFSKSNDPESVPPFLHTTQATLLDGTSADIHQLIIPRGYKLKIIDGSHRYRAICECLELLQRTAPDDPRLQNFDVPVTIELGTSFQEEVNRFLQINQNAKPVPINHALELSYRLSQADPRHKENLERTGKDWSVRAYDIANYLSDNHDHWKGRIRFAEQAKGATILNLSSVVNSLKPIITNDNFLIRGETYQNSIISSYWDAIGDIYPEALGDPQKYVVQKALGVTVFHRLLPTVLAHMVNKGMDPTKSSDYKAILNDPLNCLNDLNAEGDEVAGEEFWVSGSKGAAGGFSSEAGRRILLVRLQKALPRITA